jgi:hypothetical protein
MVVATLLHPSRDTATTIVASESRLVASGIGEVVAAAFGCFNPKVVVQVYGESPSSVAQAT